MESEHSIASLPAGPTRLFAPWSPESLQHCRWDADGFLEDTPHAFAFKHLFDTHCTLVVAPPWLGKTTVAEDIIRYLHQTRGRLHDDLVFGEWYHLTSLGERLTGTPLAPLWWPQWAGQERDIACWIVDALDEARHLSEPGLLRHLLRLLSDLTPDQRSRLRLLLFGRTAEIPKEFLDSLQRLYDQEHRRVVLLPLDRKNAEEFLGADAFPRVLTLIRRCGLRHLARYPAILKYLKEQEEDTQVTERDAWQGVLQELLEEPNGLGGKRQERELEERFQAAAHLAAVLTFSGTEEIANEEFYMAGKRPSLSDLIPHNSWLSRPAAREVLASGMFWPTPTGTRFIQRNVREWMCAFGVKDLPLARLRPLLVQRSDTEEFISPQFRDLAIFLRKTATQNQELRTWLDRLNLGILPTDAAPPSFEEVVNLLDRFESLAAESGWDGRLAFEESPTQLDTPGVGTELAKRLADRKKPLSARVLLLRIAATVGDTEPAAVAARIVHDSEENSDFRFWCASYLGRIEDKESLRSLVQFVRSADFESPNEREISSTLISAFMRVRLWGAAEAYQFLPMLAEGDPATTLFLSLEIAEHMTAADALKILKTIPSKELMQLGRRDSDRQTSRASSPAARSYCKALAAIVEKIAVDYGEDSEILTQLIPFALTIHSERSHELSSRLCAAYKKSRNVRRKLFLAYVEEILHDRRYVFPWWPRNVLKAEDLQWLESQLPGLAAGADFVWLTFLDLGLHDNISPRRRDQCCDFVRLHAPEVLDSLENIAKQESTEKRRSEERSQLRRPLADVNDEILGNETLSPRQRLQKLMYSNFQMQIIHVANAVGTWEELPQHLRDRVLDACQEAMDQVEPTPIPLGRTFPGDILCEAHAFVALLRERPADFELTSERIQKWLPAVLVVIHGSTKHDVLHKCHQRDSLITEKRLLEAIQRELEQEGHYSVLLQDLPPDLWTPRLTDWFANQIRNQGIPEKFKPRLLELLAERKPEKGEELARVIVKEGAPENLLGLHDDLLIVDLEDNIGYRALDILLALDPDSAWPLVKQGFEKLQGKLLENLKSLFGDAYGGLNVDFQTWPADRLADLEELLFRAYPPEEDPELRGEFGVTPDHLLRQSRFRVFELLYSHRRDLKDRIEELCERFPRFREWFNWRSADVEARSLLDPPAEMIGASTSDLLRPEDVVKVLLDSQYRLVRNGHDLLEVVLEELTFIGQDAQNDLPMLYFPPKKGYAPRRLREDALQVYLRRRLDDRLQGRILLELECQVKLKRRPDIKVLAQTARGEIPAVVIIEVKWSDNREVNSGVSSGLSKQLGQKYLLEEDQRFGVFVVGWNGKLGTWRDETIPRPQSPAALQKALNRQAAVFRESHPGHDIRAIVIDLEQRKDP